jgi:ketosteroid isomerase-like protein
MNRTATTFLVLVAALSSVAHAQRPTDTAAASQQSDQRGATTALRALFAAAERNDMKALDTLYAGDSLTVVEGAGINRGWLDYRDHHLAPEMKEMKNFHYRPVDIEMHVSGNTAWAIFRYNLKGEMGSRTLDNVGRGTAILERRGSGASARWVVRHTQTSSRARRPSDPPAG